VCNNALVLPIDLSLLSSTPGSSKFDDSRKIYFDLFKICSALAAGSIMENVGVYYIETLAYLLTYSMVQSPS
jgi:hypothetical protein